MPYAGAVDDFRAARALKRPRRVPCVALSEEFDVRWHGRWCYEEVCQDGDKIFEVLKSSAEEFDYDWVWAQIDDCYEFEPLGVAVKGEGNILRATCGYLPMSREHLAKLPRMDPRKDGRMPEKLKAIRKLREHFGETALVVGSCAAPFSAVGLMWGIENSMLLVGDDPELLRDAMDYWDGFYRRYIEAQRDAGAHAIWFGDCNAFSGLLSAPQYEKHVLEVTRGLVRHAEEKLGVMIWMHNSETQAGHVASHLPLGVSFENIGPAGDMGKILGTVRGRQAVTGNLDPLEVLYRGTPKLIESEVRRLMELCKPGGGWVFNTGEMNPREVPEENMRAMMKAAKSLAKY
jgi:uroporphyrinogen decarboxylase